MEFNELIDRFQNDSIPENRRQAAYDLMENHMDNEICITAFAKGLLDSDAGVRDVCQRALIEVPDNLRKKAASLVAVYIAMQDIVVRNLAGDILIKLGNDAVDVLLPYLKDGDHDVRRFTCDILGLIADKSIANYIIPLLEDVDRNVQISAVETLGNIKAEEALDQIIMLYEAFDEIRPNIIESIGKIGGENAESYLLEKLDEESNQFLQATIIDALAFNATDIDISYKLLEKMEDAHQEIQKLMLMTAFAISFRLEETLLMPDELRYVAYKAMLENDTNIKTAGVLSLGEKYREEDLESLFIVLRQNEPELHQLITYNLLVNSEVNLLQNITELFESGFLNMNFLENIIFAWKDTPKENKEIVIDNLLNSFEQTIEEESIYDTFDVLITQYKDSFVYDKLHQYTLETSEENKQKLQPLLKTE